MQIAVMSNNERLYNTHTKSPSPNSQQGVRQVFLPYIKRIHVAALKPAEYFNDPLFLLRKEIVRILSRYIFVI